VLEAGFCRVTAQTKDTPPGFSHMLLPLPLQNNNGLIFLQEFSNAGNILQTLFLIIPEPVIL
jgi:hypothetical protein